VVEVVFLLCLSFFNLGCAAILIQEKPASVIMGEQSGLGRPEGIAFSPEGDLIAVANASMNSVTFYKRKNASSAEYEKIPFFTIQGARSLIYYPHDVCFSPDGQHLAVVNSRSNSITIYKKNSDRYDPIPTAVIRGEHSGLKHPHAVKYAPHGKFIAVANLLGNTITLYQYEGDTYSGSPYHVIQNSKYRVFNRPDGLAFSSDGELLAVTNHDAHSVAIYQELPHSPGFYTADPVEILQGEVTNLCYPHSLSFHPSNEYLAVSCAGGIKTLNLFKKISEQFPRYSTTPEKTMEVFNPETIQLQKEWPQEGGVKGIAFSPDKNQLGLCAADILNPDRSILIYSIEHLP
jgi:DNA-binding beta-propeller fold protein YncE